MLMVFFMHANFSNVFLLDNDHENAQYHVNSLLAKVPLCWLLSNPPRFPYHLNDDLLPGGGRSPLLSFALIASHNNHHHITMLIFSYMGLNSALINGLFPSPSY